MNEILAPLYYVFTNDNSPLFAQNVEADSFFCFTILMADIKDSFIKELDESKSGIKARVKNLEFKLSKIDF